LYLHYYICVFLGILTVISWGALVPLYIVADGDVERDTDKTGLSNAIHDEYYMISPTIAYAVYVVLATYLY